MSTLQEAVALIKAGDKQGGQRILARLLAHDPSNEAAWLWMSSIVEQDAQRRYCLKQILKHNPDHTVAQAALARLQEPKAEKPPEPTETVAELPAIPAPVSSWGQEGARAAIGDGALPVKTPAWESPAPPARDPAMEKDMADFVIAQLGKHERPDNIVLKLCEGSGMSWSEATAFVQRVEQERRPEIASRQRPILLLVGAVSLLVGGYLAYNSASYLAGLAASIDGFGRNPLFYLLSTPELARRVITLAVATAIIVGGLWGTVRALLPPGDRSLLAPAGHDAAGKDAGSIDDFVGIHVALGGHESSSSGRRKNQQ